MSYQKFVVDNMTCSRRFHVTFDDESKSVKSTDVVCPHCQITVWTAENHPKVTLARDENLVKTTQLSRQLTRECAFKDTFQSP
jgi:DNA-directed RNA polymerase subunit RPC12/RpoP